MRRVLKKTLMFFKRLLLFIISLSLPLVVYRVVVFDIPITVFDVVLYGAGIVSCFFFGREILAGLLRSARSEPARIFWAIYLLYAAGALLSVVISQDFWSALGYWRAYVLNPLVAIVLVGGIISHEEDLYVLAKGYVASCILLVCYGVFEMIAVGGLDIVRMDALFQSPNYLALYITPAAVMLVWAIGRSSREERLGYIVSLAIVVAGIVATFSRGAVIALLITWAVSLISGLQQKTARIMIGAGMILVIFTSYGIARLLLPGRSIQSDSIRVAIMRESVAIGFEHPLLGVGLGDFQRVFANRTAHMINFPEYITPHARTPHNLWLNAWLQTSLLGLISMLALTWYGLSKSAQRVFSREQKQLYRGLVVLYVAYGFFEAVFWKNDLAVLFWLIFALPTYWHHTQGDK